MRRSGKGSGGGLGMNKGVQPKYRTGDANKAIRPAGVAQIGVSQGSHVTGKRSELPYRGISMKAGAALPSELGNKIATQAVCGVGGSRTIHKTGSQQGLVTRANSPRGRSFDQKG